jgi:ABC-type polysaccharide/polyol phosphate export permease
MNTIKKLLGYVWMLFAPTIIVFLIIEAKNKITIATEATRANTILQWVIILLIFTPICVGFFIFGKYASENAYDHLPESSAEIED